MARVEDEKPAKPRTAKDVPIITEGPAYGEREDDGLGIEREWHWW